MMIYIYIYIYSNLPLIYNLFSYMRYLNNMKASSFLLFFKLSIIWQKVRCLGYLVRIEFTIFALPAWFTNHCITWDIQSELLVLADFCLFFPSSSSPQRRLWLTIVRHTSTRKRNFDVSTLRQAAWDYDYILLDNLFGPLCKQQSIILFRKMYCILQIPSMSIGLQPHHNCDGTEVSEGSNVFLWEWSC